MSAAAAPEPSARPVPPAATDDVEEIEEIPDSVDGDGGGARDASSVPPPCNTLTPPSPPSATPPSPPSATPPAASKHPPTRRARAAATAGAGGWDGFDGYMAVKNAKLRAQFDVEFGGRSGGACALRGVVVWVDGGTSPPREDLRALVGHGGGRFETYFGPGVTHVVCERLAQATRLRLGKAVKGRGLQIVTPAWVVRCIEEGRRVGESGFGVEGVREKGQKGIGGFFGVGTGRVAKKGNRGK